MASRITNTARNVPLGRYDAPLAVLTQSFGRFDAPFGRFDAPFGRFDAPLGRFDAPFGRFDAIRILAVLSHWPFLFFGHIDHIPLDHTHVSERDYVWLLQRVQLQH